MPEVAIERILEDVAQVAQQPTSAQLPGYERALTALREVLESNPTEDPA